MSDAELIGTVLDGRYRVISPIAEGAMGSVYRGERVNLGREVAIKVMRGALPGELSSRERFAREAQVMAKLDHPHCVAVIDFGVHDDKPYVVMDLVRGTSLIDLLAGTRFVPRRAAEIMRQMLSGLAHAHELGIIHRDIKPANVMVATQTALGEQVKLLDFGLARFVEQSTKLTTGIVVGTPNYIAPEQCRGQEIDTRADLYACGVVLFEMLTGEKPFAADDPVGVVRKHLHQPAPTLASVAPGLELAAFEPIIARALAKAPSDRYASAAEMAAAIAAVVDALPSIVPATASAPVRASQPDVATASGWEVPAGYTPPSDHVGRVVPATRPALPARSPVPPTRPMAQGRPVPKRALLVGGGVFATVVIIAIAARSGSSSKVAAPADAALVVAKLPIDAAVADPVAVALAQANDLFAQGHLEHALEIVNAARLLAPQNAQLAYLDGRIYFSKLWWTDGIRCLRDAIRLDPAFRSDPELIKTVLRGFLITPRTESNLAAFLVELGPDARPLVEDAAQNHPNRALRDRATALLRRFHD